MKTIISVLVENRSGVLSRTAGLFARRGFNIESLAVGETEDPTVSRMTIVVEGDDRIVEQVGKRLNKLVDVIKVRELPAETSARRELALIKVNASSKNRGQINELVEIMKAKIVDISPTTLTVEIVDRPERVTQFLGMVMPYGVVEIARTGMIAMQKGSEALMITEQ